MSENRVEIPESSQKNDLVLAELLQEKFDLNRHINSHDEKAQTLTRKHIQPAFYINLYRPAVDLCRILTGHQQKTHEGDRFFFFFFAVRAATI